MWTRPEAASLAVEATKEAYQVELQVAEVQKTLVEEEPVPVLLKRMVVEAKMTIDCHRCPQTHLFRVVTEQILVAAVERHNQVEAFHILHSRRPIGQEAGAVHPFQVVEVEAYSILLAAWFQEGLEGVRRPNYYCHIRLEEEGVLILAPSMASVVCFAKTSSGLHPSYFSRPVCLLFAEEAQGLRPTQP